ncbi:MAG: cytochrome P450 [Caldilineaceae bacterium]|nr:cytochrome P450 [Caldilineaceae bacterium]MDE0337646.1 cytochrome P450 [Caldilineaceae bacterium]
MSQITDKLRVVEEFLLLVLDSDHGDIRHSFPLPSRAVAFAGAALMDLALEQRIKADLWRPEILVVSDPTPLGSDLLDPILAKIARDGETTREIAFWVTDLADSSDEIRENALARLIERGILEAETSGEVYLSADVSRARRYNTADDKATEEVQLRIMRTLFSDDIPDPRDIVIVSLASASGVFESMLSQDELAQTQDRIDAISRLDLICREIAATNRRVNVPPPAAPSSVGNATKIPAAAGMPLLGNVFNMAGDLRGFLIQQYLELGPIFQISALNNRFIVLAGPEGNTFVQRNGRIHLRSYESWRNFNAAMGARDALMSMDGQQHIRMRKVQKRGFSGPFVEDRLDKVVDITRRLIAEWPEDRPFVVQHAMQKIITEHIAVLTTGVSALDYIDDLIAFLNGMLSVHVMRQRPGLLLRLTRLTRARERMDELFAAVMARHEEEERSDQDLIDDLLDLHKRDPQFFPETAMQLAVLGPFFAGIETSANTVSFMLYAVLKHPELLERMTAEADAWFDEGTLAAEGMHRLEVTKRIFMETLRMYPVIPALMRHVINSFEFGGYTVPAGSNVIVGNTVAHHLPQCFPNPERFDIDRFSPERAEHSQSGAFAPFGLGVHRCLGMNFAEVQVVVALLTIARYFEIRLDPPGYNLKIDYTPTPHPAKSFKVRTLRRRQHSL